MNKLKEVYEQFKHLNKLLTDPELELGTFINHISFRLWKAVKEAVEEEMKPANGKEKNRNL